MLDFSIPAAEPTLAEATFSNHSVVPDSIPLQKLRAGQQGVIAFLAGRAHDVARLAEMGLRRGASVVVIRNGITCILQLDGNRLCIRLSKDLKILVTPL